MHGKCFLYYLLSRKKKFSYVTSTGHLLDIHWSSTGPDQQFKHVITFLFLTQNKWNLLGIAFLAVLIATYQGEIFFWLSGPSWPGSVLDFYWTFTGLLLDFTGLFTGHVKQIFINKEKKFVHHNFHGKHIC